MQDADILCIERFFMIKFNKALLFYKIKQYRTFAARLTYPSGLTTNTGSVLNVTNAVFTVVGKWNVTVFAIYIRLIANLYFKKKVIDCILKICFEKKMQ